mmetsp:Transcript_4432/g.6527  ORF Transcript_4432/g.6527 Transcript_4432/m.6527 type:complete len:164 (-) Transcript_4432:3931-4422(-)
MEIEIELEPYDNQGTNRTEESTQNMRRPDAFTKTQGKHQELNQVETEEDARSSVFSENLHSQKPSGDARKKIGDQEYANFPVSTTNADEISEVILTDVDGDFIDIERKKRENGSGTRMGGFSKNAFEANRAQAMQFRYGWANRTIFSDWMVTWLSPFVDYLQD